MASSNVSPAQTIREWLQQADQLPDGSVSVWHSTVADTVVRFSSTDATTAAKYRSRMAGGGECGASKKRLRFHLVETERVGWSAPGQSEIWRNRARWLDEHFAGEGLAALMPETRCEDAGYPWVFFDPSTGCGLMLVRSVSDLPPWAAGSPFGLLFHLAFAWRRWRFLHAATLGVEGSGVLLVGSGGAGKSASTLAGIRAGLQTVGDDYVMLQPDPDPIAWPVYRCLKQSPVGLCRFPGLSTALADEESNWHGKIEFDPDPLFPGCWASSLRLRAIVVPQISNATATIFSAIRPTTAFSTLAASLFPQLPGARLAGFALLTRLTRALPAFEAKLSSDVDEIGAAFHRFVRQGHA